MDVLCSAIEVLGNIESKEAVPPLINIITDTDTDVRSSAIRALGN
ncbi:HEAT repeat domain-containing protein, partial [Okeania hirsuta]